MAIIYLATPMVLFITDKVHLKHTLEHGVKVKTG